MSFNSSALSSTTITATPIPPVTSSTAELIADLQKYNNNLPEIFSKGTKDKTLKEIADKMEKCAASFPEIYLSQEPIVILHVDEIQDTAKLQRPKITPSRLVSKVNLLSKRKRGRRIAVETDGDAIVIVNAQKIHIISLIPLRLFSIRAWQIGGETSKKDERGKTQTILDAKPFSFDDAYAFFDPADNMLTGRVGRITQLFIDQIKAAHDFITTNGIDKARLPSSRDELLSRILGLLAIGLTRDPSVIVVSYVQDELVKSHALGLHNDPWAKSGLIRDMD